MNSVALYSPRVLALATSLADALLDDSLPLRGSARSATCGSTLEVGLTLDATGRIVRVGLKAQACAIGQAAAALFVAGAAGRTRADVAAALEAIDAWLGGGTLPDWQGFDAIAPARDFPARHGAITLAWRAALVAWGASG